MRILKRVPLVSMWRLLCWPRHQISLPPDPGFFGGSLRDHLQLPPAFAVSNLLTQMHKSGFRVMGLISLRTIDQVNTSKSFPVALDRGSLVKQTRQKLAGYS